MPCGTRWAARERYLAELSGAFHEPDLVTLGSEQIALRICHVHIGMAGSQPRPSKHESTRGHRSGFLNNAALRLGSDHVLRRV